DSGAVQHRPARQGDRGPQRAHAQGHRRREPVSRPEQEAVMTGRPYTPETLAERWSCKPQHVRALLLRRALKGFRVGKLWRIAADEVERYEREGESCAHESNEPPPSEGSTSG